MNESGLLNGIGEPRILRPGRLKWFLVTGVGVVLGGGGVLMIKNNEPAGWFVAGFFGLVAAIGFLQFLGIASSLELRPDGFTARSLGRRIEARWDECSPFGLARMGHNHLVTFSRTQDARSKLGKLNQGLVGATSALPDTYGLRPGDLAELMNAYRDDALGRNAR